MIRACVVEPAPIVRLRQHLCGWVIKQMELGWDSPRSSMAWWCKCFSRTSCLARMAVRCSAINSRSAALDLEERSDGETQESALDDRRERAHPVGDAMYGNLPAINFSVEEEIVRSVSLMFINFQLRCLYQCQFTDN